MLDLAKKYAKLMKATILDHKIYGDEIVFVLSTGPKLRFTKEQLESEIEKHTPTEQAEKPVKPKAEKPKKGE